jgi:hypothetical protein
MDQSALTSRDLHRIDAAAARSRRFKFTFTVFVGDPSSLCTAKQGFPVSVGDFFHHPFISALQCSIGGIAALDGA